MEYNNNNVGYNQLVVLERQIVHYTKYCGC